MIRAITYGADEIACTKSDAASIERLKLGLWAPDTVTGGTVEWDAASKVARIVATSKTVRIARAR